MKWMSAASECQLANISNTDELCDAQTELKGDVDVNYWTALKEKNGSYFWGNVNGVNQLVGRLNSEAFLDKTEPGNCYVISRDTMKLKSRDCNNEVKGRLCSYYDDSKGLSIIVGSF